MAKRYYELRSHGRRKPYSPIIELNNLGVVKDLSRLLTFGEVGRVDRFVVFSADANVNLQGTHIGEPEVLHFAVCKSGVDLIGEKFGYALKEVDNVRARRVSDNVRKLRQTVELQMY